MGRAVGLVEISVGVTVGSDDGFRLGFTDGNTLGGRNLNSVEAIGNDTTYPPPLVYP